MSHHESTEKTEQTSSASRLKEINEVLAKHQITRGITPEKLREILEDLGPTFIKIGQIMSLHSDILPKRYCDELMKLDSEVPPMPFEDVLEVLDATYTEPWQDIFSEINHDTLGSASIAQVHRAKLKSGEDVIVKVQRKGIRETMQRDMRLLHKAVKLLPPIGDLKHLVDLGQVLDEMWKVTEEELNFLTEADNMEEFAANNSGLNYIRVPRLYRQYTTQTVLVMEYIGGCSITDLAYLKKYEYDTEEVGRKLINNYIKQIMDDGFFHADPHPGNVKVLDGKIVWIDMGMMGRLSERDRHLLAQAIDGIASNDISKIENAVLQLGEFWNKPDWDALYSGIRDFLESYGHSTFGQIDLGDVLQNLMDIMKENRVRMPHGLTMLARGLSHMEGVLEILSPNINMMEIAADRMREEYFANMDWKAELQRGGWKFYRSLRKGAQIPGLVSDIMNEYLKGKSRFNMELRASNDFAWLLRYLVRNIVIGLWVTALIVGSSIICNTDMQPEILGMPWLAFLGFLASGIIVLGVILRHFLTKRRK